MKPATGGSFIREKDGSLTQVQGTGFTPAAKTKPLAKPVAKTPEGKTEEGGDA